MINTIKKAVERITWRLNNGWKANENDIEAINFIVDYVNTTSNKTIQNNELTAKLYIFAYSQFLKRYNATVFDDIPRKELNKMLSKPLGLYYEKFKNDLNTTELYQHFQEHNIEINHPMLMTEEEKEKIKIIDVWDYETVKENLERDIVNIINLNL